MIIAFVVQAGDRTKSQKSNHMFELFKEVITLKLEIAKTKDKNRFSRGEIPYQMGMNAPASEQDLSASSGEFW